jgi:hypothetical protein
MRRAFRDGVLAVLVAFPAIAAGGTSRWGDEDRPVITERMGDEGAFTCSAGGEGSILVAAAVFGTLVGRRRAQR